MTTKSYKKWLTDDSKQKFGYQLDGGGLLSEIMSLTFNGNTQLIDHFGQALTVQENPEVMVAWNNGFDFFYDMKEPILVGTGTYSTDGGYLQVIGGDGEAHAETLNYVRYVYGRGIYATFTAGFEGTGGDAGMYVKGEDGFVIRSDGVNLQFGYLANNNGTEKGSYKPLQGDDLGFDDVDLSGLEDFDISALNIYIILAGHLGSASPMLFVRHKGRLIHIHTIMTEGVIKVPHIRYPVFPFAVTAKAGGQVNSGSCNLGTFGEGEIQSRPYFFPSQAMINGVAAGQLTQGEYTVKSGGAPFATDLQTIAIFKVKDNLNGHPNRLPVILTNFEVEAFPIGASAGALTFQFIAISDIATQLTGTPSFVDENTLSSVVQVDHAPDTGASVQYISGTAQGGILHMGTLIYSADQKTSSQIKLSVNPELLNAKVRPKGIVALVVKNNVDESVKLYTTIRAREIR